MVRDGELNGSILKPNNVSQRSMRKSHILLFFFVVVCISFAPLALAGVSLWTIYPGVYFRATPTGGNIDFASFITASQVQISSGLVDFAALTMDGKYISSLGLNASSNCDLTLTDVESDRVVYNVAANIGQTSITHVKIPPSIEVETVKKATSWIVDESTNTIKITNFHLGAKTITILFKDQTAANTANLVLKDASLAFSLCMIIVFFAAMSMVLKNPDGSIIGFILGFTITIVLLVIVLNALVYRI